MQNQKLNIEKKFFTISILIIIISSIIIIIKKMETKKRQKPTLPKKLKIGYTNWGECDEKVFESVKNGLNVIIWFSIDLNENPITKECEIQRGLDYKKVALMTKKFKDNNYKVINLISIGGWNSKHISEKFTAEEYYETFIKFNEKISNPSLDFYGFDGIDWDIEGHDDFSNSINHFTIKELDLMGQLSVLLKKNNFIVSMAPSESYLDPFIEDFSLSLLFNHKEWEKEFPNFTYHGRNCYAYLIKKYGIENFDFVSFQFYEGYTHALYKYEREKKFFGEILVEFLNKVTNGFYVDFSSVEDTGLKREKIIIPQDKIVIGLANAWANGRFLFLPKKEIIESYKFIVENNFDIRGMMFWNIGDEDIIRDGEVFNMAKIFNEILL